MSSYYQDPPPEDCLEPTDIIDSDHPQVLAHVRRTIGPGGKDPIAAAVNLYNAVRDGIWYDPYFPFHLPKYYRASFILEQQRGFCVPKAALLCALGRAAGIPARIGFATVKNHLATRQLIDYMGSDLFVYHGYVELHLQNKWVKATPTFNRELCARHRVPPLDFNGRDDALFHAFNTRNQRYMEYVDYHGTYADVPVDQLVAAWKEAYGEQRVATWIDSFEDRQGRSGRDFYSEEPVKE